MWKSKRMQTKKKDNGDNSEKKGYKKSSNKRKNDTQENRRNNRDDDNNDRRNNRRNNGNDRRNNGNDRRNNRRNNDGRRNRNYGGRNYNRENVTKIKMSYLPHDISYRELRDLIESDEWGKIGNIKINTYENEYDKVTVAYIDFYNESEADYFVSAINCSRNIDPTYRILLEVRKLDK
jgi:hypothetical protein